MERYTTKLIRNLVAGLACVTALPLAASAVPTTDKGTALSAVSNIAEITCSSESEAAVDLLTELTTTGSVDSTAVYISIDSAEPFQATTITPRDFVHTGRIKTAEELVTNTLTNGEHTIQACFIQSGAQGRAPKTVCADPVAVTVNCAES